MHFSHYFYLVSKDYYVLRLISLFFILLAVAPASAEVSRVSERYLQELDSVLQKREMYCELKRERVNRMLALGNNIKAEADLYLHNSQVYDECFTFDCEVAMDMVQQNKEIAERRGDAEAVLDWKIKESFLLASTGQFLEAVAAVEGINASVLPHGLQLSYYDQMQYLYSHMNQYSWGEGLKELYSSMNNAYNDSIYAIIKPLDNDYVWFKGWQDLSHGNAQESISQLKGEVDTLGLDTRHDAMLAYVLARLYESEGDRDNYIRYMTSSARADICSANMDIASLEELAIVLFDEGDLDRAYKYITVCMETARLYNNQARMVSVARVMDSVFASYQERDRGQRQRLTWLLWGLALAVVLLLVVIALDVRHRRRLTRSRAELEQVNAELERHRADLAAANVQLTETNAKLQEAMAQQADVNQQLSESNAVKEEYISYLFSMCSNYISKIDDFRKNINRKAKVKQWDEVLQMTDKGNVVQDELKEFYHNFDAIFLNLYPDFVSQFNALLSPEEQIVPKKGELLNTDLRIYALVRLGINDSTKIAEFLHCSPQTVYNNRLKVRGRALVEKEDFVKVVQQLGRN